MRNLIKVALVIAIALTGTVQAKEYSYKLAKSYNVRAVDVGYARLVQDTNKSYVGLDNCLNIAKSKGSQKNAIDGKILEIKYQCVQTSFPFFGEISGSQKSNSDFTNILYMYK